MRQVPVFYIRSSSYGSFSICEQMWAIEYAIGRKAPSSDKATHGSVVHKVLEMLASHKLATQKDETVFRDEELNTTFAVSGFTVEDAMNASYNFYCEKESHLVWNKHIYRKCFNLVSDTLTMQNGIFDPRKRTIVAPETYFDIELTEPGFEYTYQLPTGTVTGRLRLKGTIDLLTDLGDGKMEMIDWKTGARRDWATGEEKDYTKLTKDFQLRLYVFALLRKFPEIKTLFATIVFIKGGGGFTVPLSREDDAETLQMIRDRFEQMQKTLVPRVIDSRSSEASKCRWCFWGNNLQEGTRDTICEHYRKKIAKDGLLNVIEQEGGYVSIANYGDGGGVSNRDEKKAKESS